MSEIKSHQSVIIVTGFGGFTGSKLTLMVLALLHKTPETTIYSTLPMPYEGKCKNFIAFDTLAKCYLKRTQAHLDMKLQHFEMLAGFPELFTEDAYSIMDTTIKSMIRLQLTGYKETIF